MKIRLVGPVGLALLLAAIIGISSAAAQAGLTFFITDVDAEAFPQVTFSLRAVELGNNVVSSLNESNVTVYENGEQCDIRVFWHPANGAREGVSYVFECRRGGKTAHCSTGINQQHD